MCAHAWRPNWDNFCRWLIEVPLERRANRSHHLQRWPRHFHMRFCFRFFFLFHCTKLHLRRSRCTLNDRSIYIKCVRWFRVVIYTVAWTFHIRRNTSIEMHGPAVDAFMWKSHVKWSMHWDGFSDKPIMRIGASLRKARRVLLRRTHASHQSRLSRSSAFLPNFPNYRIRLNNFVRCGKGKTPVQTN